MRNIYIFISVFFFFCCHSTPHPYPEIELVKVYYLSPNILTPIRTDRKSIRLVEPYTIEDKATIDSLRFFINNLVEFEGEYHEGSIVLSCDFYFKDGSKENLLYDLGEIVFDGEVYYKDNDLIRILSSDPR